MERINLGEWTPDQPGISGSLTTATNVVPQQVGYGPFPEAAVYSSAASQPLLSSFAGVYGNTLVLFAGGATKLFKFNDLTTALTDVSKAGSYTSTDGWEFAQFGNIVIAANNEDKLQAWNLTSSTAFADLSVNAPIAKFVTVVRDFVVAANIGSGTNPSKVQWSDLNDETDWLPGPTSQSDFQEMSDGGNITGLTGGEFGLVLMERAIARMTYSGSPYFFQFDIISRGLGCIESGSVAQYGNRVFFLSDAGFKCLIAGQEPVQNIGSEKVDRTFISEVPRDDWDRIFTAIDPQSKVVVWCVPNSKLWIYNWELDRWTTSTPNAEGVFSGFTTSTDLETLAVTYPDLDAMTISLDSPRWSGGSPRLYVVQSQEVGTFYGDRLEATFEYSFNELSPGRVARVRTIRPVTDATDGHTITIDCRARLGDAENIKTASAIRTSGIMPVRGSGRYIRPSWTIAAATSWSYAQGLYLELEAGGER